MEKQVKIRIPEELHAAIVELAKRDVRTIAGEIVVLLQKAVEQERAEKK